MHRIKCPSLHHGLRPLPKEQVSCDENADSDVIDSERALKTRANILAWQTMQHENQQRLEHNGCNRRQTTEHCEHKQGEHNHGTKTIVEPEKITSSAQRAKKRKSKQLFLTIKEMKGSKRNYQDYWSLDDVVFNRN
ncbi:uncharacterized protein M8220_015906 isoform 1-T1 [Acridotheres tristis]